MTIADFRVGNYFLDRRSVVRRLDFWDGPTKLAQEVISLGDPVHPITEEIEYVSPSHLKIKNLIEFGFIKTPVIIRHGNGQDWTPEYPKTEITDYRLIQDGRDLIIRYEVFHWINDKNQIETDEPTQSIIFDAYYIPVQVKFVHQLQNLYFALTGNELTIKSTAKIIDSLRELSDEETAKNLERMAMNYIKSK